MPRVRSQVPFVWTSTATVAAAAAAAAAVLLWWPSSGGRDARTPDAAARMRGVSRSAGHALQLR